MDGEQILLNMFKQQHYDESQYRMQKIIMILSVGGSALGAMIMSIFFYDALHLYFLIGSVVLGSLVLLFSGLKASRLNTGSFIYMIFACFVLVPVLWNFTGVQGGAPYISLAILVSVLSMFSKWRLRAMLFTYLPLLIYLTVISAITEIPKQADPTSLIYILAGYLMALGLTSTYILSTIKRFEELNDQFLKSSIKDDLTQVYNRKLLDMILHYEETLYKKEKSDYILVMFDVDKFKEMNDEHGHMYGDIILRNVAQCLTKKIRESDFIVRYGGDEFLVVLTAATGSSLRAFIDRVNDAMGISCDMEIKIEASFGYAARSECASTEEVLALADKRLYEMKEKQRRGAAEK